MVCEGGDRGVVRSQVHEAEGVRRHSEWPRQATSLGPSEAEVQAGQGGREVVGASLNPEQSFPHINALL